MTAHFPPTPLEPEQAPPPRTHRRRLEKPPRRRWKFSPALWAAAVVVILLVVIGLVYALRDPAPPTTSAGVPIVTTTPSAPSAVPVTDLPEGAFAGDGGPGDVQVYVVGKHIQPGTYTTAGALDPAIAGHWERLQFRTEGDVPRRVRGGEVVGPQTVTLEIGDIFETRGFKPWHPAPEE